MKCNPFSVSFLIENINLANMKIADYDQFDTDMYDVPGLLSYYVGEDDLYFELDYNINEITRFASVAKVQEIVVKYENKQY